MSNTAALSVAPWFVMALAACVPALAESPPTHVYDIVDGLPSNRVTALLEDRHGFLWIGTRDGLARFDGGTFVSYGTGDGLPGTDIADLVETAAGELFVATNRGLARLAETTRPGEPAFVPLTGTGAPLDIHALASAPGTLLCATGEGLYRLRLEGAPAWEPIALPRTAAGSSAAGLEFVFVDTRRNVWAGGFLGLYRLAPDGHADYWATARELPNWPTTWLMTMAEDDEGRLWVGGSQNCWRLAVDPRAGVSPVEHDFSPDVVIPANRVFHLERRRGGGLWAATARGPVRIEHLPSGAFLFEAVDPSRPEGLAVTEDRAGNLWFAAGSRGLARVAAQGFTSYGADDGLLHQEIEALGESPRGELLVLARGTYLFRHAGRRFERIVLSRETTGWGIGTRFLFDRGGALWFATVNGLLRWPGSNDLTSIGRRLPERIFDRRDGLPSDFTSVVHEDARGDVWLAMDYVKGEEARVCRWERAADRMHCIPPAAGGPRDTVRVFADDGADGVWAGTGSGELLRCAGARCRALTAADGFTADAVSDLLLDGAGGLWIAARGRGVYRIDDTRPGNLHPVLFSTTNGLSSNDVRCLVRDGAGRIYIGNARGVDRLDPKSGRVRRLSREDGLANTELRLAFRTRDGKLWFGTADGLSRLDPSLESAGAPPEASIVALRIAGEPLEIPSRGAVTLPALELAPDDHNLQIDFTGVSRRPGGRLRFQTLLEGADESWTAAAEARSVTYARLAPGRYHFRVRAVDAEGNSGAPASVAFRVLAPVWRRAWFLALAGLTLGASAAWAHRQRVRRLVESERIRTRIATDLHDDIGSSLTQIAIQAGVLRRQFDTAPENARRRLEGIARLSADLVDGLGDVVWAINPARDHLEDLVSRMRHSALEMLEPREIALQFDAPSDSLGQSLDTDVRRDVYLAFKELVHNAARHSRASTVSITLAVDAGVLEVAVRDDGCGFAPGPSRVGNGLVNVSRRAAAMGGSFVIGPRPGGGTEAVLTVPLHRAGRRWLPVWAGRARRREGSFGVGSRP